MAGLMVAAEIEQLVGMEGEATAGEMEAEQGVVVTVGEAKAGMEQNEAEKAADATARTSRQQRVGEKEQAEIVVVQREAWKRGANGGGGDGGGGEGSRGEAGGEAGGEKGREGGGGDGGGKGDGGDGQEGGKGWGVRGWWKA